MGQYYKPVNIDKFNYLYSHDYGDGLKLMEFSASSHGILAAVASLITLTKDFRGSWAGDRIVLAGDYADKGNFVPSVANNFNLYELSSSWDADDIEKIGGPAVFETLPKYTRVVPGDIPEYQWLKQVANVNHLKEEASQAHALSDASQVFDQPEDIFEAIGYYQDEDPLRCLENLFTFMRMSELPNTFAWQHDYTSTLKTDAVSGKVLQWDCVGKCRNTFRRTKTSLSFPATAGDVLKFLTPL